MATERQIAANRLNAQKSTGPRTEEGKRASSQNALGHGLRAAELTFPGDFSNEAEGFIETIEVEFDPQTPFEEMLVARIASQTWRLRRALSFETETLSDFSQKENRLSVMDHIANYETKVERSLQRNIAYLKKLQTERALDTDPLGIIRQVTGALNRRKKGVDHESNERTQSAALLMMAESLKKLCETSHLLKPAAPEQKTNSNERTQSQASEIPSDLTEDAEPVRGYAFRPVQNHEALITNSNERTQSADFPTEKAKIRQGMATAWLMSDSKPNERTQSQSNPRPMYDYRKVRSMVGIPV